MTASRPLASHQGVPLAPHPGMPLAAAVRAPSPAMYALLRDVPLRYRHSRDALHAFFTALGAAQGTPVWMPSFHCGVEVRAAVDAGFVPYFYRVGDDLAVDEDDLASGLRAAPGPVLAIHYFGFAQPGIARIAALCAAAGVPLVEDCAHAPLSALDGRALGTFAPAAALNLAKTFGTADGGALRIDTDALARITSRPFALAAPRRGPFVAWDAQRDDRRRRTRDRPPSERDPARAHAVLAERYGARVATAESNIFARNQHYGRGISALSLALLRRCDPAAAMQRRRANYVRLDALLHDVPGYRPLHTVLLDGAVPLYFPLLVRDRTELLLRLQAQGIATFVFGMFRHPALDPARFPETRRLRDEILCLPVHQDLRDGDVERIANVLRPLLADDARAAAKRGGAEGADDANGGGRERAGAMTDG